MYLIVMQHYY